MKKSDLRKIIFALEQGKKVEVNDVAHTFVREYLKDNLHPRFRELQSDWDFELENDTYRIYFEDPEITLIKKEEMDRKMTSKEYVNLIVALEKGKKSIITPMEEILLQEFLDKIDHPCKKNLVSEESISEKHVIVYFSPGCKKTPPRLTLIQGGKKNPLKAPVPLNPPKICSCGKVHKSIPKSARGARDTGLFWECQCGSTLFLPWKKVVGKRKKNPTAHDLKVDKMYHEMIEAYISGNNALAKKLALKLSKEELSQSKLEDVAHTLKRLSKE